MYVFLILIINTHDSDFPLLASLNFNILLLLAMVSIIMFYRPTVFISSTNVWFCMFLGNETLTLSPLTTVFSLRPVARSLTEPRGVFSFQLMVGGTFCPSSKGQMAYVCLPSFEVVNQMPPS